MNNEINYNGNEFANLTTEQMRKLDNLLIEYGDEESMKMIIDTFKVGYKQTLEEAEKVADSTDSNAKEIIRLSIVAYEKYCYVYHYGNLLISFLKAHKK